MDEVVETLEGNDHCRDGSAYLNTYYLQRPTLPPLAPEFSVVAMLLFVIFGNVYPREVRAIVCWYRLGMHSQVPGEWPLLFLPQLEIVRPGAEAGRVLPFSAGSVSPWVWGEGPSSTALSVSYPGSPTHIGWSLDLLQDNVLCLVNFLRRGRH